MSRNECWQVADTLGLDQASFDGALDFFHRVSLMFYFRDILPHVVFIDPQVMLDKVSELIEFMFELREPEDQDESAPNTPPTASMSPGTVASTPKKHTFSRTFSQRNCPPPPLNYQVSHPSSLLMMHLRRCCFLQQPTFSLLVGKNSTSLDILPSSFLRANNSGAITTLASSHLMI